MQTTTPSFAHRLDAEWARLRTSRRCVQRARAWRSGDPDDPLDAVLASIDDLDDLIRATQRGAGADGSDNAILLRLVELASADELAGRIVIQRILPGLISRAARYRDFRDHIDPVEIVVPAAWFAVRTHDTIGRRNHVAATLISDAVYDAFRRPLRRRASTEVVTPSHRLGLRVPETAVGAPLVELAEVIRDASAAGVARVDTDLLCHLARAESVGAVASERGVTDRTIRNHRRRAVANVRAAIAA